MDKEHTRELIDGLYSTIQFAQDEIKKIQCECKHEETHMIKCSWRPGAYSTRKVCVHCDALVDTDEYNKQFIIKNDGE